MNYITEINGFERWLEINYLHPTAQLLWYKLMYYNNRFGWEEWFQVDNRRLMMALQISREASLIEHRDRLVNAGLIDFKKGRKGAPNSYRMISFTYNLKAETVVETVVEPVVKPVVKPVVESVVINKHKTKNKTINIYTPGFETFWDAYPRKVGKIAAFKHWEKLDVDPDVLIVCAKNYAEFCVLTETPDQYIKHPSTFLGKDRPFEDYTAENYKRPKQKKSTNHFHDMLKRDTDYDALLRGRYGNENL